MMVIERFYFSTGGHIKAIFLKKTLDKSIKIEGFALKMMTFFKEAFQVNRKSYPERVRSALFHAIKKTAANLDACVKVPGKDFSRKRKLPLQTMLLMLIGMGGGSLSKELYDWFGYTPSTATASAFVQQRNKIRSKAIEMIFNEFVASAMPTMTFRGYRLFAVDGSDLRLPSDPTNDFSLIRNSDRGFQYTNRTFHHKLVQAGMTQSMSRVAHCIDNGPMEGFWGILKRERYYGRRFTSKRELIQTIENYIHYYNTRRVQRNLGVLTPMEKHTLCLAA